jgi:arylsulfatase
MTEQPNILLLMTDQHRGDCLSIDGHPYLQTPYIDHLAASGFRFRNGYTACPVCVPARRTLMTGKTPEGHGVFMNYHTWLDGPTLPEVLGEAGYQTHLVGKLHLWPLRKMYGFQSADWADSPHDENDDYHAFLREKGATMPLAGVSHGANYNGWVARPWHLPEELHFTNWCADKAMQFLARRDPTRPFFLKVSFHQPHEPCTPPQAYWDRYMAMDIPAPPVGEWARVYDEPNIGQTVTSWRTALPPALQKQYQVGYYGTINHIDDQIGRLLVRVPKNTIILFISDHGEMLGEHQWIRKRTPYEGSARIPYIINLPDGFGIEQGRVLDAPVELMDIMPTLLDAVDVDIPDSVEGSSLLPLLRGEAGPPREYLHGECCAVPEMDGGMQYLTDGRRKYALFPGRLEEQYFDLEKDPGEMVNLIDDPSYGSEIDVWRKRLKERLKDRPERFVENGEFRQTDGSTPPCLPGMEKERFLDRLR